MAMVMFIMIITSINNINDTTTTMLAVTGSRPSRRLLVAGKTDHHDGVATWCNRR